MTACMGGFCPVRDRCDLYENGPMKTESPPQRICPIGRETPVPIVVVATTEAEK